jgi:hypothetical protein
MSSIANEINDDNDDFDELTFTPKSALISPLSSNERQPSLIPPSDENFTIDPPSEVSQESLTNGNTLITEEKKTKFISRCNGNRTIGSIGTNIDYLSLRSNEKFDTGNN